MAYSANGNNFPDKSISRVKYDLEYDSDNDLYRFKGKAPELIQIQLAVGVDAEDVFFDSSNDYEPVWFEVSTLDYVYGGQIFTDVTNEKNMIWTNEEITGDCLDEVNDFIKNPA